VQNRSSFLGLITDTIRGSVKIGRFEGEGRAGARVCMSRVVCWIVAVGLVAGAAGCCDSPWRFYQNAYGWNCPQPDRFAPGPPAVRTTPPGPTTTFNELPKDATTP